MSICTHIRPWSLSTQKPSSAGSEKTCMAFIDTFWPTCWASTVETGAASAVPTLP